MFTDPAVSSPSQGPLATLRGPAPTSAIGAGPPSRDISAPGRGPVAPTSANGVGSPSHGAHAIMRRPVVPTSTIGVRPPSHGAPATMPRLVAPTSSSKVGSMRGKGSSTRTAGPPVPSRDRQGAGSTSDIPSSSATPKQLFKMSRTERSKRAVPETGASTPPWQSRLRVAAPMGGSLSRPQHRASDAVRKRPISGAPQHETGGRAARSNTHGQPGPSSKRPRVNSGSATSDRSTHNQRDRRPGSAQPKEGPVLRGGRAPPFTAFRNGRVRTLSYTFSRRG